jgi:hypothetical protein
VRDFAPLVGVRKDALDPKEVDPGTGETTEVLLAVGEIEQRAGSRVEAKTLGKGGARSRIVVVIPNVLPPNSARDLEGSSA